ncbi:MAG: hypothetical protein R2750_13820 [Bacteroidales bacterium]
MKKLILLVLIVPFLFSCNQKKIKQLEQQNDSLKQQTTSKDDAIIDFLQAINDIQENLDSIKEREMIISEQTEGKTELQKSVQENINDDVNKIYNLMLESRAQLEAAQKKLGKSNYYVKELETMLANMTKQLEQKDEEIAGLVVALQEMNIKIETLTKDVSRLDSEGKEKTKTIENQAKEIEGQTIEINTAYYTVGTSKDLKEQNIITAEGGFIGIGKSKKLNDNVDDSKFTKIDIRTTTVINIPGKKATIVTNHPTDSYEITGEDTGRILTIKDYKNFWKSSRYLVVVVQ